MKLREHIAMGWQAGGIGTVCFGLVMMRHGHPFAAGFIGGLAVWMGRKAGRAEIGAGLTEVLLGRSCSIVLKEGKLVGLRVDP